MISRGVEGKYGCQRMLKREEGRGSDMRMIKLLLTRKTTQEYFYAHGGCTRARVGTEKETASKSKVAIIRVSQQHSCVIMHKQKFPSEMGPLNASSTIKK